MPTSPMHAHLQALHRSQRANTSSRNIVSTADLLREARSGQDKGKRDEAAKQLALRLRSHCAAVLCRHNPRLDPEQLEDLVQDLIVRLLSSPVECDPSPAYLQTAAHHLLIDQYRRLRRRGQDSKPVSFEEWNEQFGLDIVDQAAGPEEIAVESVAAVELRRRIARHLRPRDLAIVEMRCAGHAHEEIAEALGLTNAHVRKLWERAQSRLRSVVPQTA